MYKGHSDERKKLIEHLVVLVLAILALALTGVSLSIAGQVTSRAEIMAIPIAVKTLVFIAYQLLTEHVEKFSRWKSLKAYMILNVIEPVFWLAVVVLKFMGVSTICNGSSCAVNVVIAVVAMVIVAISLHVAWISIRMYRESKRLGDRQGSSYEY